MLDTDQLRSFLAIVDTGSFTRAAERVNKTQSAVSMHMRRLEEQLERPLFVKQGRGTRLTSDGERLVDHARRMLEVEAAALYDLKQHGLAGRVVFGIPDDYAEPFLPDIVKRFTRQHPLVELSIVCHPSVDLAQRIMTGEVDVAVVTDCERIKGLEILREEALCWVAGLRSGPIEDQRPLPLALSTPTCPWRNAALEALDAAGIASRIFLMSTNYAALAPIIQAGLALTVLPRAAVNLASQRLVPSSAGLPVLSNVKVGLLRGSSGRSKEAAALTDVIRASIGVAAGSALDVAA
ncbi:LysR family transcriptional regulator [Lichenihabitans psoromatis]|uniref:LysR family transcriptional regulator n=1 Tax=Lichenihabitans psoromatis TaxID=2528642 RepID=UPI0010362549|nr:LysR family transcriptional regulator [Lichenihabitans psoromatis]